MRPARRGRRLGPLPPEARAGDVRGAFAVGDDLMTTGRTLAEIARGFKAARAARVEVRGFAPTSRPGDE